MKGRQLFLLLFLPFLVNTCHKEGSEDFLLALTQSPPVLTELNPSFGTPRQLGERPYPPTVIRALGRNLADPQVSFFFNTIPAPILLRLPNEVQVEVPDGTTSGFFTAIKGSGLCPADTKQSSTCSRLPFFVDCYSPYNEEFGKEISIQPGESKKISYKGIETKAFRANLTNSFSVATKVQISCPGPVTVRVFSSSCEVQDFILVREPEFPLGDSRIVQFLVTAGESDCTISFR